MGREWNWATKYTEIEAEFELEWQKSKDKALTRLYWNNYSPVYGFFCLTCLTLITGFEWSSESEHAQYVK